MDNQMIFEVIVEKLEEGMKIILRGHPSFINEEKKKYEMQLRILSQYKDFIFDDGNAERFCKKMRIDCVDTLSIAMYNSFALLSDSSSLAYTYPFVSLKPCIMYLDDLLEGGISLDGISYCNKIMHLVVHNADDLKKSINKAMDKNIQQEYAINIKQLQNKEIYNIEHSAKEIAVAIKRILRKNNL
ncbi:hypothetical protein B6S12_03185 [Helicobacter valdiviensis]|uniref:Uncharacterized protein n=1 Tax=Helicobacter valdiviensis TaxID=1458358 RepID=A0A2W6MWD0_9HELI|nr:hypothetical protein B6S12_03185 [Helicobacter valdiviensis]